MDELIKIANDIARLKDYISNGALDHGCVTKDMIELGDAIKILKVKNEQLKRK